MKNQLRSPKEIKTDMLEWARTNLFARVGKEWDYAGEDFDPLIHLMVGATASEVKNIYESINDSDRRVLKQLAQMLLPEAKHLPSPAHALIKVTPSQPTYQLSETLQLFCDMAGEKVFLSPVYEHAIANLNLKYIASDLGVYVHKPETVYSNYMPLKPMAQKNGVVSHLMLGFECPSPVSSLKNTSFYFDLKGSENARSPFLNAVTNGTWYAHDNEIATIQGFSDQLNPEDLLDTTKAIRQRITNIYKSCFTTITDEAVFNPEQTSVREKVKQWMKERNIYNPNLDDQLDELGNAQGNHLWIMVQLQYPTVVDDFFNNFTCSTQVFPAVNRCYQIKDDAQTYFNESALNVVQIQSENPILGIRRVTHQQTGQLFDIRPLAYLKGEEKPSYSIRYGGVGRLDTYNVWQRCLYLLNVFREENRLKEVVNKIGSNLSLEDFHILLGEKIDKDEFMMAQNPLHFLYLFMHPGFAMKGVRAIVEYWTTLGNEANDIPVKQALRCEVIVAGLKKEDKSEIYGHLVTSTTGGRKLSNDTELFHALKDAIIRKERLITPSDIEAFCRMKVQSGIDEISITKGIDMDARPGFGITRTIQVNLIVSSSNEIKWNAICRELEHSLQENSLSNLPYRVKFVFNDKD
jgi:hypothetical protein